MPEKVFKYARFDLDALLSLAAQIRGQPCCCDVTRAPKAGSMNCVMFISFEDGLDRVFRSPKTGAHAIMSDESARKMLLSEVATLRFLRRRTAVPGPEVQCEQNPIGVPYILMSKAAGRPLSDYDWADIRTPGYRKLLPLLPMPDGARESIMSQLGTMMQELSKQSFGKIGSLFENSDGSVEVGECLSPALVWQHRDSLEDPGIERGPFLQANQYFSALISAFTGHVTELPLTPYAFFAPIPDHSEYSDWASYRAAVARWNDYVAVGSKIESGENRFAYCLAGQIMSEMIPHFVGETECYTISHPDLHIGNIFVNDDFNITCLIDWGSTSTGPVAELMATPNLSDDPSEHLVSALRQGFDPQKLLSSESWRRSDMIRPFTRLVRLLSKHDYPLFKTLYALVHDATANDEDVMHHLNNLAMQESNERLLATLKVDDDTAEEVEQQEPAAFGTSANKSDGRAVARKLTVMAEMNKNFVTNATLWKWIEDAVTIELGG
ncbi:hypothetical protein NLG97_g6414 [Lecanicillium saksenae]|uniref:Uncharacterized protein n=1 Tax=Lecanicillium saksenae TaxID=468837 RepID=A0ACC1QPQ9_9HYPO|nr:hypothetical protein NLG97_g6414 [Lecanicillium saksenae]